MTSKSQSRCFEQHSISYSMPLQLPVDFIFADAAAATDADP